MTNEPVWSDYFEYDGLNLIWKPRKEKVPNARFTGKIAGWVSCSKRNSYIDVEFLGKTHKAHRIIWEMHYGKIPEGFQIDHIDQDGTNNRISNLRLVTNSLNQQNARLWLKNQSGVTGVSWHKGKRQWQVRIKENGENRQLGHFNDFFEAVCRRKSAEVELGFHENHGRRG